MYRSLPLVKSSVGSKYVMALTGLGLMFFVLGHMAGNLLVFAGRDALNSYAHALKHAPVLLWTVRSGLLAIFVVHVVLGIRLTLQNTAARGTPYVYEDTVEANWASRHMMLTGLVILAFLLYHLAHFTFGWVAKADLPLGVRSNYLDLVDPAGRQDVYAMVIYGFRNPWITLSYLIAQGFLGLHLWHGGSSWFQSLGLNAPRYEGVVHRIGPIVATVVVVGNCSMPLAIFVSDSLSLSLFQP
jgi:succinate dehydrogenase / fumarate reductase cytochrome b subunit